MEFAQKREKGSKWDECQRVSNGFSSEEGEGVEVMSAKV